MPWYIAIKRHPYRYLNHEHLARDLASLRLEDTAPSLDGPNGIQSNGAIPHAQSQSSPEKGARLELPPPTSDEWETLPSLNPPGILGTRAGGFTPAKPKASNARAKRTPNILGSPSAA